MDTFSTTLLVASLRSVAALPALIDLAGDTSMLFTRYDLENSGKTELWKELSKVPVRRSQRAVMQLLTWLYDDAPPDVAFKDDDVW